MNINIKNEKVFIKIQLFSFTFISATASSRWSGPCIFDRIIMIAVKQEETFTHNLTPDTSGTKLMMILPQI